MDLQPSRRFTAMWPERAPSSRVTATCSTPPDASETTPCQRPRESDPLRPSAADPPRRRPMLRASLLAHSRGTGRTRRSTTCEAVPDAALDGSGVGQSLMAKTGQKQLAVYTPGHLENSTRPITSDLSWTRAGACRC
jgi:hypothetical protein